jgi:hypothetical protein
MLSLTLLSVMFYSYAVCIIPRGIMLSVIMLSVVMLSVIMLSVIMLSIIMLSFATLYYHDESLYAVCRGAVTLTREH